MINILDQVREYCHCLPEFITDDELKRVVDRVIAIVSNKTCWSQTSYENMLHSKRTEKMRFNKSVLDLCLCDGGIVEFKPFYRMGIDAESFIVIVRTRSGIHTTKDILAVDKYTFDELDNTLRIDVSDFAQCGCCPDETTLIIEYYAGFDELPSCVMDLVCGLINTVEEATRCDCESCHECEASTDEGKIEFGSPQGSSQYVYVDTVERMLKKLMSEELYNQLRLISICRPRKTITRYEI